MHVDVLLHTHDLLNVSPDICGHFEVVNANLEPTILTSPGTNTSSVQTEGPHTSRLVWSNKVPRYNFSSHDSMAGLRTAVITHVKTC